MGYSLARYVVAKDPLTGNCEAQGVGAQPGDDSSVEVIISVSDQDAHQFDGVIVAPMGPANELIVAYTGATTGLYKDHSSAGSAPWVKFCYPTNGDDAVTYQWVLDGHGPPCTLKITIKRD